MINLISFTTESAEYSVDLHLIEMGESKRNVMFITATKFGLEEYDQDYTVIFNGLPTTKQMKRVYDNDTDAIEPIINAFKGAVKYACEYWNFIEGEWTDNLDNLLDDLKQGVGDERRNALGEIRYMSPAQVAKAKEVFSEVKD